ncbi:MAG: hydroxymethylglutaryl-CoA reductase, degradative [Deltaproteobacteria bacterium]|nr:MAG: hydroxymethylglutaryl-CoA reductase, degradative [Deltaproteobacteria bacterium]
MKSRPQGSRYSGFHRIGLGERRRWLAEWLGEPEDELAAGLDGGGLDLSLADRLSENVVGIYSLPFSVATNFLVNGTDVLVPMVCEEPSVVAAASNAARIARAGGGFIVESTEPLMACQIMLECDEPRGVLERILQRKDELIELANSTDPVLVRAGGGAVSLEGREISPPGERPMLVLHLLVDVRDAMGANALNGMGEKIAPEIERIAEAEVRMVILTNRLDHRLTRARVSVPIDALAFSGYSGRRVAEGIVTAWRFARHDPYRAATHNKGILNGIGAVALATANDWRAMEAAAHAHACKSGRYLPLSEWRMDEGGELLEGELEVPLALGTVGGATSVHPQARLALRIARCSSSAELCGIAAACGLANNMAALRALSTEGIQRGHMRLHRRAVAAAGAKKAGGSSRVSV